MLCPNCGTDVGDKQTLCARCAAQNEAASSSSASGATSIGAIRPNIKIVRLKPGESPPPGYVPAGSTPSPTPSPEPSPLAQMPPVFDTTPPSEPIVQQPIPTYAPPPVQEIEKPPSDSWRVVFGTVLILIAAWGTVIIVKNGFFQKVTSPTFSLPTEAPGSDFSHIVIHQRREVVVDGKTIVGKFELDGEPLGLSSVQASWSKSKKYLQLDYFGTIPKELESRFPAALPTEPLVKVQLQFAPGTAALDREKLQSYLVEFLGEETPMRFVKTYSQHLAAFGEISPLSGTLKTGETVRGTLRDARISERNGKTEKVAWDLGFQAVLGVVP